MNRKNLLVLLGVLFLAIGLAACNDDKAAPDEEVEVDEEVSQASIAEGEKIAKSSCISCHGVDLKGDMGPGLHNLSLTKEEIVDVLVKGRNSMPPATAKGHEEDVAAYLMTLK